jgi:hypothetical protein
MNFIGLFCRVGATVANGRSGSDDGKPDCRLDAEDTGRRSEAASGEETKGVGVNGRWAARADNVTVANIIINEDKRANRGRQRHIPIVGGVERSE